MVLSPYLLLTTLAGASGCLVTFDETLLQRRDGGQDLPPCSSVSCDGDRLVGCGRTIEECSTGCSADPAPAHCRGVIPSNGLPAPAPELRGDLTVSSSSVLDTCSGLLDGAAIPDTLFSVKEQATGPKVGVLRVRAAMISRGATLTALGSCALALIAGEVIEVGGTLDLRGGLNAVYVAGPGGGQGGYHGQAEGCGAGSTAGELTGGGGGALGAAGGRGGKATGSFTGAAGGKPCASETLEPLVGGSGGGRGGCKGATCSAGHGGGGGGAVVLVAGRAIRLLDGAAINAGGGGGAGGLDGLVGGGGGGSGGSILLESPAVEISAQAALAAAGGGGGGISTEGATDSAAGQSGGLSSQPAAGGKGLVGGGDGSSPPEGAGARGATGKEGGGGGGGGWGRVRVNSASGQVTLPAMQASVSQGKVRVQ